MFWCIVDVGWIMGYFYLVYGLLVNGVKIILFEGVLNYFIIVCMSEVVDKYKVNIFYIVLMVICVLMVKGDEVIKGISCDSLCIMGFVGELINLEVWEWYYCMIGNEKLLIVDIWW